MEWVETTGRSVEEAKDAALDQLGVDETDAEVVVVSEPRTGLFGRIRGEARVRARVRPTSPPPKRGRARRGAQQARSSSRGRTAGSEKEAKASAGVSVAEREQGEVRGGKAKGRSAGNGASRDGDTGDGGTTGGSRSQKRRRRRSRGGGQSGASRPAAAGGRREGGAAAVAERLGGDGGEETKDGPAQAGVTRTVASGDTKEDVVGEDLSLEEQGESAREFVEGLVELLGLRASVTAGTIDTDTVQVSVEGSELGILIGPGAATLTALQELARTVVQRRTGGRTERILVDVAGYRAKRAAALQRFTREVAEEVLSNGSERALEPMSPPDRKVVHDTINEIEGVGTRSVGEEPRRYIIVAPTSQAAEGVEHA